MVIPNGKTTPIFAILFDDIEAGKKIFAGWKKRFGTRNTDEEIRISLVKGIDRYKPLYYKVGIGSSKKAFEKERINNPSKFFTANTRIHVMTPQSLQNLDNFKV